jgi:hypothetical protein
LPRPANLDLVDRGNTTTFFFRIHYSPPRSAALSFSSVFLTAVVTGYGSQLRRHPRDSIHIVVGVLGGDGAGFHHGIDRLLPTPVEDVQSRIDSETRTTRSSILRTASTSGAWWSGPRNTLMAPFTPSCGGTHVREGRFMSKGNRLFGFKSCSEAEDHAAGWGLERRLTRLSGSGRSIKRFGCDFALHTVH